MDFRNNIFWRIIGLLGLLIGLSSLLIGIYAVQSNREDHCRRGRQQAFLIAQQAAKMISWDDRVAIRELLDHAVTAPPHIRYAFVERDGKSYVESPAVGIPRELLCNSGSKLHHEIQRQFQDQKGKVFYDIGIDVPGEQAAVHIGLDLAGVDRDALPSLIWLAAVGIGFFLLLLPVAHRVSLAITNEVDSMTLRLRESNETLEARVVERTAEITRLNETLEQRIAERTEELKKSEALLMEAQRIAHLGSFEYVAATREIIWSKEEYCIYGLDPAGAPVSYDVMFQKYIHPDDRGLLDEVFTKAMQTRSTYELEHRVVRPDGSVRWVYNRAYPYFDEQGVLVRYVGTTLDITERKKAEEALRESEERLRLAQDAANIGTFDWDISAGKVRWAAETERIWGLTPGGYDGSYEHWKRLVHPDDRQMADELARKAVEDPKAQYSFEHRILRPSGELRWIFAKALTLRDANGRAIRMVGLNIDITERKKAEEELRRYREQLEELVKARTEALRKSEESLRNIVQTANSVIIKWKPDGTLTFVNDYCLRLFGYSREELVGKNVNVLVPEKDRFGTDLGGLVADIVSNPENYAPYENENVTSSGERLWMTWSNKALKDGNGNVTEILAIANDTSERKRAEQSLKQIEWLLSHRSAAARDAYVPPYGDMVSMNTCRIIRDSISETAFNDIVSDYLDLLESSAAVYEKNGDYALGIFSSGWCRFMDAASRRLCGSADNREAMTCGKWLCHESCWNNASKVAIETGNPVDIECNGGIRLYAVPIRVGSEIVGSINFGYGDPPRDDAKLSELAAKYEVNVEELRHHAEMYKTRPLFIIELAKHRLSASARQIGELIARRWAEESLRRSEERLRLANKATNDVVWDWDIVNDTQKWNEAGTEVFGWTEIVEHPVSANWWVERVHPEDQERVHDSFFAVVNNPKLDAWHEEYRFRKADGTYAEVMDRGYVLRDTQGKAIRMIGAMLDITQQKRFEAALHESERRFSQLIQNSFDTVVILDANGIQRYVSASAERMHGYVPAELVDIPVIERMIHPDDQARVQAAFRQIIEIGEGGAQYRHRRKDGGWVHLEARGTNQLDNPDIRGIVVNVRDITDRVQKEEALRISEEWYRTIYDTSPLAMVVWDRECVVTDWNKQAETVFGWTHEEAVGRKFFELIIPESARVSVNEVVNLLLEGRLPSHSTNENLTKSGESILCEWNNSIQRDSQGRVTGAVSLALNITERKKLEDRLRQAEKMDAVGRLAGGVAHDFNNMLQGILGYAGMLIDALPENSPLRKDAEEIQTCAERSSELTRQLLAFARKQVIAPVVFDINLRIEGMIKMLRRLISEDIELVWRPASATATIKIDPGQLDQIMVNLCVNARDAIKGVGKIEIETGTESIDESFCATHVGYFPGDYVVISFKDNGCGMEREIMTHLFEPFFTTKSLGMGTGLGLATVHGIVTQNQGFISVYSEPGKGTIFKIYLPRHMEKTAGSEIQKEAAKKPPRGQETILLVEDEPVIIHICEQSLKNLGYRVLSALTPEEAISLAEKYGKAIDLVLTDVVMPGMNGLELTKHLLVINPRIKRLFMSGFTADVIAHHGVLDKGMHFLQKPFSTMKLAEKVRQALAD